MDTFTIALWVLRLTFVGLIYLFFILVARALWRDLRASVAGAGASLGRLIVTSTTDGGPPTGTNYPLDAVNSIGRDVNNSIVIDDTYVSADHALLTFRGRAWYVEDLGSTNGTFVNGGQVDGLSPLAFGDEIQIGQVRLRLDRARG